MNTDKYDLGSYDLGAPAAPDNFRFVAYEPDTRMLRFDVPATLAGFDDATKRAEGSLNGLELYGSRLGAVVLSPTMGGFRGPKHALAYLRSIGVT